MKSIVFPLESTAGSKLMDPSHDRCMGYL
jgi:hypothetical protein